MDFLATPIAAILLTATACPVQEEATVRDELLGPPLVVNGVRIPDDQIKRMLISGPGHLFLTTQKLQVLIDKEKPLLVEEGKDPKNWVVTDEELEKAISKKLTEFEHNYPSLDTETEIRRAHGTREWFEDQMRQTMQFDKMFFPRNPDDWPILVVEAIRSQAGEFWLDDARMSYENRKSKWEAEGGDFPPEDEMYMKFVREIVVNTLHSLADIRTAADGLPTDIVMQVDDAVFTTEELWKEVRKAVTPGDVRTAKRWLAVYEAGKQRLAKETTSLDDGTEGSVLIDDEQFPEYWANFLAQFENSTFSVEAIALSGQNFPSVHSYYLYYQLYESFRRKYDRDLERGEDGQLPEVLRKQLDRTNRNLGLGLIDVEMILVSAFDFQNFRWKEDGWANAKKKAEAIKAELEKNQTAFAEYRRAKLKAVSEGKEYEGEEVKDPDVFWANMLEDHSGFWDPPPPTHGKRSMVGYKMKGRFGEKTRNDLARLMGEYFFYDLAWGRDTVTNYAFYEQLPNTIAGPLMGPWGYYITKLNRRRPPSRPLDLTNPKHYDLLVKDYLREAFVDYLQEAFDKAEVKGLEG